MYFSQFPMYHPTSKSFACNIVPIYSSSVTFSCVKHLLLYHKTISCHLPLFHSLWALPHAQLTIYGKGLFVHKHPKYAPLAACISRQQILSCPKCCPDRICVLPHMAHSPKWDIRSVSLHLFIAPELIAICSLEGSLPSSMLGLSLKMTSSSWLALKLKTSSLVILSPWRNMFNVMCTDKTLQCNHVALWSIETRFLSELGWICLLFLCSHLCGT